METLSVILQVVVFKVSKSYVPDKPMGPVALMLYKLSHKLPGEGRRLFRMAPLHHHFEAVLGEKGISEPRVVGRFWIAQFVLCCAVALAFRCSF